jgi:hypothetical protein
LTAQFLTIWTYTLYTADHRNIQEGGLMLFRRSLLAVLIGLAFGVLALSEPPIEIDRPTVIAFFPPFSADELAKDFDLNAALDDFQFYANKAREPLLKAGVNMHEVYAHEFQIRLGKDIVTVHPKKPGIGYYFVAPGKKPIVEYGVETDSDLLAAVQKHLGISVK